MRRVSRTSTVRSSGALMPRLSGAASPRAIRAAFSTFISAGNHAAPAVAGSATRRQAKTKSPAVTGSPFDHIAGRSRKVWVSPSSDSA